MTIFTQPMTGAMEKINHLVAGRPALQQELDKARRALAIAALKADLSTPFTEGGEIRTELDETAEAGNVRLAEALLGEADRDRNTMLAGAALAAGGIAGAALGGLALREVHRRGWITGAIRTVNKNLAPRVIAHHYGKLAGITTRLAIEGKVTTVTKDGDTWRGRVRLTNEGLTMHPLRNRSLKLTIPFESIIKVEQTLDQQGNVKWASIRVADIIVTTAQ